MSIRNELKDLAYTAGGSFKTREARVRICSKFADFLQAKNIQVRDVAHLKGKHLASFIAGRLSAGLNKRTLQNESTALRVALRFAGREKLADQLVNKDLGIDGADRAGTKASMTEARFNEIRHAAAARDTGVGAVVELQRAFGLRAEEAVKAFKSLEIWQKQLNQGQAVHVVFGTKGGRPRYVLPADRENAATALEKALAVKKINGGVLIAKPDEKSAMVRYRNVMSMVGATGKESGHALRYSFAQAQLEAYKRQGYTEREAFSRVSLDLGHGDGRGRYIKQVYGRK